MSKIVWLYDPETLKPIGSYDCQESPLVKGEYITPFHSVEVAPPIPGLNQEVFFNRVDGWSTVTAPVPSASDILAVKVAQLQIAVRQYTTSVAQNSPEKFNSISEAKSFAGTDNPLAAVSVAFVNWSAAVLVATNAALDPVLAGSAPLPTAAALIASLPEWVHP